MDFDLLDIEIELMLDELDDEDEVFGGWTGTLKGGADILLSKSDRFSNALAHDLEHARLKLEDIFLPSEPNRERAPENRTAVSSRWDIEFNDGPEPRLPHRYGGVGPIGSKGLIEETWEVAGCSDSGAAQLRNIETGDMPIVHAGDRLGWAEVSDITANGVEIAADDGSLYVVGAGARAGRSRSSSTKKKAPFHLWRRPNGVSESHWSWILEDLKCDYNRAVNTFRECNHQGLPIDPEDLPTRFFGPDAQNYAIEKAKLEKLGRSILERDGIVPHCDPRYVKQAKIVQRLGEACGSMIKSASGPERGAEIRCEVGCRQMTPEIAGWELLELDDPIDPDDLECTKEYDRVTRNVMDDEWDGLIAAVEANDMDLAPQSLKDRMSSQPRASFGSTAASSILSHRYGCPR